jgi:DNA polymerase-1
VYTTYLLHGTTSGRLSSRNPNLQNIVRDKLIRKQFSVSSPDNVLIQADYKQAEGRVIATLARDEYLRSIFSDPNADIFDTLTCQLYKISLDEVRNGSAESKEKRIRTKAYFYGLSYGRQAYSIAMEYNMSPAEAERNLREFMRLIPATALWQEDTKRRVLNGEDLVTFFGRKRRFHLITDENQKDVLNEALSYLPQSTASDICLKALIRLRPMLKGLGWIRLTIHDALVVECPKANQEKVTEMLRTVMLEEGAKFTTYVPFAVDVSYGPTWGDL